jgi:hypothetical protein
VDSASGGPDESSFLTLLLLTVLAPVAAPQTISGTVVDIMGTPLSGIPVAYSLGGTVQRDTTDVAGAHLLSFGTSSVPDAGSPEARHTTWGKLKAGFKDVPAAHRKAAGPRIVIFPDTLYFDGADHHWSVRHFVGAWEGDCQFNIAVPPKIWTLLPYFQNVAMEAETYKTIFFVGEQIYADMLHWPTTAFPLPVDGTNFTQANQDSLAARSLQFRLMAGVPLPFVYAPGEVESSVNGVWWIFNDTNDFVEFSADPTYELYAVGIHTEASGCMSRNISEAEMLKALGKRAPYFQDSRFGITKTNPSSFNQYDSAVVRFIYERQRRNEQGMNQARLIEVFEQSGSSQHVHRSRVSV